MSERRGYRPAARSTPYDSTWAQIGEDTPFFLASINGVRETWYQVMWHEPRGNAYYVLAPQFIAATLNTLAGASASPAAVDAMEEAQALFEKYTPAEIGKLKGSQPPRDRFILLGMMLDQYNTGVGDLGPKHCDAR